MRVVPGIPWGYIGSVRWPSEEEQILYFTHSDAPGELKGWVYDLAHMALQNIDRSVAIGQTSFNPYDVTIDFGSSLSTNFELVNVSPSGEKAIFLEGTGSPTLTPPSNPDGEVDTVAYMANVWLWEQGDIRQVGQIEVCSRNRYLWTSDEQLVAVQASGIPAPCRQANGWLIDIVNSNIKTVLPFDVYYGTAYIVSFSPDEEKLLIENKGPDDDGFFAPIIVMNLETMGTQKYDLQLVQVYPDYDRFLAVPLEWINNDEVLIMFRNDPEELFRPGILDLRSNEVVELFTDDQISMFSGKTIRWVALSPDNRHLAFSVDLEPYRVSDLWIMDLKLD